MESTKFFQHNVSDLFSKLVDCVRETRCSAPCIYKCLLASDHEAVEAEMRRKKLQIVAKPDSSSHQDWPKAHMSFLASEGLRWGTLQVHPDSEASPWFAFLTPREREVLAWAQKKFGKHVSVDVTQSINRVRVFKDRVRGMSRSHSRVPPKLDYTATTLGHRPSSLAFWILVPVYFLWLSKAESSAMCPMSCVGFAGRRA